MKHYIEDDWAIALDIGNENYLYAGAVYGQPFTP